jgi:hypothetical protein
MKDYLRQKNKYLPSIMKWVTEHGGQPTDVIPFSVEFEEKVWSLRDEPDKLAEFYKDIKVKSRISKIVTEGFTKLGLQYYFTGLFDPSLFSSKIKFTDTSQPAKKKCAAGSFKEAHSHHKLPESSTETSNVASSKPKSSLTKTFTTSARAENLLVQSRLLESLGRRVRPTWFRTEILFISNSMLHRLKRSSGVVSMSGLQMILTWQRDHATL